MTALRIWLTGVAIIALVIALHEPILFLYYLGIGIVLFGAGSLAVAIERGRQLGWADREMDELVETIRTVDVLTDQLRVLAEGSDEAKYGTLGTATVMRYVDRIHEALSGQCRPHADNRPTGGPEGRGEPGKPTDPGSPSSAVPLIPFDSLSKQERDHIGEGRPDLNIVPPLIPTQRTGHEPWPPVARAVEAETTAVNDDWLELLITRPVDGAS